MNNGTTATKGYYSILQYVPDPERAEGVNIGLMLFCPEKDFLKIRTANRHDRVQRFFGKRRDSASNLSRLDAFKTAFEERVELETGRIQTLEDFRAFVNTRANQLRLTDPRPVKVTHPEDELSNLFSLLVDDVGPVRVPTQRAKTAIKRRFDQLLTAHNLKPLVDEKFPVELPQLGKRHYPYHFQNGTGNVIEPETFELSTHQEITERACRIMIEGQDLSKLEKPIKLNVIGSFKPGQDDQSRQVRRLLENNQITLYTVDEMEKLIDVIARTAHT